MFTGPQAIATLDFRAKEIPQTAGTAVHTYL
jgi:hypothetical protein